MVGDDRRDNREDAKRRGGDQVGERDRDRRRDTNEKEVHDRDRERDRERRDRSRKRPRSRSRSREHTGFRRLRSRSRSPRERRDRDRKNKSELENEDQEEEETANAGVKREPQSLEELLAKKKAEEESKSKPKFWSKEERDLEALRKRQEEVNSLRKIQDEERSKRSAWVQAAKETNKEPERYGRRERERETKEKKEGESDRDKAKEMEAIKERYLGMAKKKRRVRRLNERKFVFEWDASGDMAVDYNPIYKDRHQVQFYGRGHVAGIDMKSQKNQNRSEFYGKLLEKRRTDGEKAQEMRGAGIPFAKTLKTNRN